MDGLAQFPPELWVQILSKLSLEKKLNCRLVCVPFRRLVDRHLLDHLLITRFDSADYALREQRTAAYHRLRAPPEQLQQQQQQRRRKRWRRRTPLNWLEMRSGLPLHELVWRLSSGDHPFARLRSLQMQQRGQLYDSWPLNLRHLQSLQQLRSLHLQIKIENPERIQLPSVRRLVLDYDDELRRPEDRPDLLRAFPALASLQCRLENLQNTQEQASNGLRKLRLHELGKKFTEEMAGRIRRLFSRLEKLSFRESELELLESLGQFPQVARLEFEGDFHWLPKGRLVSLLHKAVHRLQRQLDLRRTSCTLWGYPLGQDQGEAERLCRYLRSFYFADGSIDRLHFDRRQADKSRSRGMRRMMPSFSGEGQPLNVALQEFPLLQAFQILPETPQSMLDQLPDRFPFLHELSSDGVLTRKVDLTFLERLSELRTLILREIRPVDWQPLVNAALRLPRLQELEVTSSQDQDSISKRLLRVMRERARNSPHEWFGLTIDFSDEARAEIRRLAEGIEENLECDL